MVGISSLILGSGSPRRKELLERVGFSFSVRVSDIDEWLPEHSFPEEAVLELSQKKNEAISIEENEVLLTADTIVAVDGECLGKPITQADARCSLRRLSGQTHQVLTGVSIRKNQTVSSFVTRTDVTFFPLSEESISWYIATGEAWDKAGGYGIQGKGALLVEEIHGDFFSVVGLPISRVVRELKEFNITIE